jgi:Uma2 family endonuclease
MPAVTPRPRRGEPAWTIAELFPAQGHWSEEEYLDLRTNRLVEFDDGVIEVLPMPTTSHQYILLYLFDLMRAHVAAHDLGEIIFAPIKVRLWPGKYREPDIVFVTKAHADRIHEEYWAGADLVVEVVSPDAPGRKRDLREKRRDYARGRIPEYWIVDPQEHRITVLRMRAGKYVEHGRFAAGAKATSARWPGFAVDVDDLFRAARR